MKYKDNVSIQLTANFMFGDSIFKDIISKI